MKWLIVFTMHRQIHNLCQVSRSISNMDCDILIHTNGDAKAAVMTQKYFRHHKTQVLWTNVNSGYSNGPMDAMYTLFPLTEKYDCALHLHPDVIIREKKKFLKKFEHFCTSNYSLAASKLFGSYRKTNNHKLGTWGFDMFMFKHSKIRRDIFKRTIRGIVEWQFTKAIERFSVDVLYIERFKNDWWNRKLDKIGLEHFHGNHTCV